MELAESTIPVYVYSLNMSKPFSWSRIYKSRTDAENAAIKLDNRYHLDPTYRKQYISIHKTLGILDSETKRVFLLYPQSGIYMGEAITDHLRGFQIEDDVQMEQATILPSNISDAPML